jgi:type IV pilus assembly protein PilN
VIRINLLPHREEKRKERRKYFLIVAFVDAVVAAVVIGLVWAYFDSEITTQNLRNDFLKKENAKLDKEIEEIQKLKEETDRLLARKQVIERLQGDRSEPVILLDQLARRVPDGVYIKSITPENGARIRITGFAQSSARVSTLMRNLDASPYMEGAELTEIKASIENKRRLNEFSLTFKMKRTATDDQKKKDAGKAAATPAAPATAAPATAAPASAAGATKAPAAAAPATAPAAAPATPPAPAPAAVPAKK